MGGIENTVVFKKDTNKSSIELLAKKQIQTSVSVFPSELIQQNLHLWFQFLLGTFFIFFFCPCVEAFQAPLCWWQQQTCALCQLWYCFLPSPSPLPYRSCASIHVNGPFDDVVIWHGRTCVIQSGEVKQRKWIKAMMSPWHVMTHELRLMCLIAGIVKQTVQRHAQWSG